MKEKSKKKIESKKKIASKKRASTRKHLHAPVKLNVDLILTEEDIESRVTPREGAEEAGTWEARGDMTHHLSPESRLLIIYSEASGPRLFKLKEDSQLLKKHKEKHSRKK